MDTKQMYVANVNMVFGSNEEPLIYRVDDIVLPALNSGILKEVSSKTRLIFESVKLNEISDGNWVLQGILIKDTVLDVMSEYSKLDGLQKTEKHVKSSPYSLFMIYLRNHRMVLVKNQSGSPDIRSFSGAFKHVVRNYIISINRQLEGSGKENKLPMPQIAVTGIKTTQSVREALKDVERINELVIKFYPLNAEWDYDPVFGEIDQKIRKKIQTNKGKMVFPSPQSKDGVAEMIEATEGLVKTEMKVTYRESTRAGGENSKRRTGKIKDDQISEVMTVEVEKELDEAYDEIDSFGKTIRALNVQTQNHIIDYNKFLEARKK